MKKELHIINEISRMREMMGFGDLNNNTKKYINESINGNTKYLLTEAAIPKDEFLIMLYKALTGDDSFAERFGKSVSDQWDAGARNLADVLERNGLDDIGRLQELISLSKGIDKNLVDSKMVEDALKLYFKNNPTIAEKILKNSTWFIEQTLTRKDFITILGAANRQLADDLDYVIKMLPATYNQADMNALRPQLDNLINTFKNSGLDLNDPAIKEVLDGFIDITKTSDSFNTRVEPGLDAVNIPKAEIEGGKTQAEIDAEKLEADRIAQEDADANTRSNNEAADRERLQKIKDERLGDVMPTLKSDPNYKPAFSWLTRVLSYFKLGSASDFLAKAESQFSNMTIRDLVNFQTSTTYKTLTDELKAKAKGRSDNVGKGLEKTTKRVTAVTKLMEVIQNFFKKSLVLGLFTIIVSAIFSMYLIYECLNDFEFVNDFTDNIKLFLLEGISTTGVIDDPRKTLPNCLHYIYGYYDLPLEVRNDVNTIGLTCDNLNQEDPTNFASNIVFVKGGTKMDNTGNKVTTKDKFVVKIGGNEVPFEIGGGSTPTPPVAGVYTNTQNDFIKWVGTNHPGKYGTDYEWEGTAGYYYPPGGTSGNAMTFSPSGWQ